MVKNIIESNNKNNSNNKNKEKINNEIYNNLIEELKLLIEEENLEEHKVIANEYSQSNINGIYNKIIERDIKNIKDCGYENSNFRSSVIEFNKYLIRVRYLVSEE